MHQLSQGSQYHMTNIFRVSHIFPAYFTTFQASEITKKYKKRRKISHIERGEHLITSLLLTRVCVFVYVCVCLRPSTVKASSVWGWNSRGQINDIVLKTFLSSSKSLYGQFSMKHRGFLTSCFILFIHQMWTKPRLNQLYAHLSFRK